MLLKSTTTTLSLLFVVLGGLASSKEYVWIQNAIEHDYDDKRLVGHVVESFDGAQLVTQCAMRCHLSQACRSYNYSPKNKVCQLNSETHARFPKDLQDVEDFQYYLRESFTVDKEALGACGSQPCLNGGRCLDIKSAGVSRFLCLCKAGWAGSTCSDKENELKWADWKDWGACSVSCGDGYKVRRRNCQNEATGEIRSASDCFGADREYQACNLQECPAWGNWQPWEDCSTFHTCGEGSKMRLRTCQHGGTSGVDRLCMGPVNETTVCNSPNCQGPVKLEEGATFGEGRVLIYNDIEKAWGGVCASNWDLHDAKVLCRQMGFMDGASEAPTYDLPTSGVQLVDVQCAGSETALARCKHGGWGTSGSCAIGKAAGAKCIVRGGFGAWTPWADCSVTCEKGRQVRTRKCDYPPALRGGKDCSSDTTEYKECVLKACPVDGEWNGWMDWGACTVECGGGTRERMRSCVQPMHGGVSCTGTNKDLEDCNPQPCPIDGVWKNWSAWEDCSVSCGGGTRMRNRECDAPKYSGTPCSGDSNDSEACQTQACPIGGAWLEWSQWDDCSVSCGGGTHTRRRTCNNPKYGGTPCAGPAEESEICSDNSCPVDGSWGPWQEWTTCSETCGEGTQVRSRECNVPKYGGASCGDAHTETRDCFPRQCPIHGVFQEWSDWGDCNAECGDGVKSRSRVCIEPQYGGNDCDGAPVEVEHCYLKSCAVDGVWREWGAWGDCSLTCGGGISIRSRDCQAPLFDGKDCEGDNEEQKACNTHHCPADGVWEAWSAWEGCSKSCGTGATYRTRVCKQPKYSGAACDGQDREDDTCNEEPCPIDGEWSSWTRWFECNATCGEGHTYRFRTCSGSQHGGKDCDGQPKETMPCNTQHCPIHGAWSEWGGWHDCTVSCGTGSKTRQRTCEGTKYGGDPCQGQDTDTAECNTSPCPVDGEWSNWDAWQQCTKSCGTGSMMRMRSCEGTKYAGAPCPGDNSETADCKTDPCPIDGQWDPWSAWGDCTLVCGGGVKRRDRECVGRKYGGAECAGSTADETECNVQACPIDGEWQPWKAWSECDVPCGGGEQTRQRVCAGIKYGGKNCPNSDTDVLACNTHNCPIDGVWSAWATWSLCSLDCGGGSRSRSRTCDGTKYGGSDCPEAPGEDEECNTQPCPMDGEWSNWDAWQQCTKSCGTGSMMRMRSCEGTKYAGAPCPGDNSETADCKTDPCPIDGQWDPWSAWGDCTLVCGGGVKRRDRECVGRKYGGAECAGSTADETECNVQACPIDGEWQPWTAWSECDVPCGGGEQTRQRVCAGIKYGGKNCPNSDTDVLACNTNNCPIDGVWSAWATWSLCSLDCGGGSRSRSRTCDGTKYGGSDCPEAPGEDEECNTQPCPIDGYYKEWQEWSGCTDTCGGGKRSRVRKCVPPKYAGADCPGPDSDTEDCNVQDCLIPGDWMEWNAWGACSKTCGGGSRVRTRDCDLESQGDLTSPCEGISENSDDCNPMSCDTLPKTCKEWADAGLINDEVIEIDPDGIEDTPTIKVHCNIEKGEMTFHHNYEDPHPVQGYETPGGFEGTIRYTDPEGGDVDFEQLIKAVDVSASCRQHISWKCQMAAINSPEVDESSDTEASSTSVYRITYWTNRHGEEMSYFGNVTREQIKEAENMLMAARGLTSKRVPLVLCECHIEGKCKDPEALCNCDLNSEEMVEDQGWLVFKEDLPMMQFRAGDTGGGTEDEKGEFYVGPLLCEGMGEDEFSWKKK